MIVHMIGNAHIETAGQWSFDAGKDEALATLRSAVERCEEYPEFKFTSGEIWTLQLVEKLDDKLFKRIRKLLKRGQWNLGSGCYTLPHPYLMSGAVWSRQVAFGHHYCLDKFGKTPQVAVNLSAKAFPVSYYRNLLRAGYKSMVFFMDGQKPAGMESSIFRWVNEGGEELLCYRISPHYRTRSHELYGQIMECVESGSLTLGHTLCFYGVGNHGGGPTKENIEYIRDHRDSFENVELKFSTLDEFFSHALLMSDSFPVFEGPIGVAAPGHFINRRRQRKQQRAAENTVLQAERLCEQLGNKRLVRDVESKLDEVWGDLMRGASYCLATGNFADVNLPSLDAMQFGVIRQSTEWIWNISRSWARERLEEFNYQQIVAINTNHHAVERWIEHEPNLDFDDWGKRKLCDSDGNLLPYQILKTADKPNPVTRLLFRASIPAKSAKQFLLREFPDIMVDAGGVEDPKPEGVLKVLKTSIENSHWTLRLSPRSINRISPASDKEYNFLGKLGLSFSLSENRLDPDAMELDKAPPVYAAGLESEGWEVVENGKLRASMVNRGKIGNSPYVWKVSLCEGDPKIYCSFSIAYVEAFRHLELNLYLENSVENWNVATSSGGQISKSSNQIHPFHGWISSVGESRRFAVISDDFFACRHSEQCLTFLMVRSPVSWESQNGTSSQPCFSGASDLGLHEYRWVMIPDCTIDAKGLENELLDIQQPLIVFDRYEGLNRPPWENSTPANLQESNELRALNDGQMKHLGIDPNTVKTIASSI